MHGNAFCENLQVIMIGSTKKNGTVKQNSGCHLLISFLKELILLLCFSLSGTKFQIIGPRFDILSEPW